MLVEARCWQKGTHWERCVRGGIFHLVKPEPSMRGSVIFFASGIIIMEHTKVHSNNHNFQPCGHIVTI